MVEPRHHASLSRSVTPTPTSRLFSPWAQLEEPPVVVLNFPPEPEDFCENSDTSPSVIPELLALSRDGTEAHSPMQSDASRRSESYVSDHARPGPNRRRSRPSNSANTPLSSGPHGFRSHSNFAFSTPATGSENIHGRSAAPIFQGGYSPTSLGYGQAGYMGQYGHPQHAPINVAPSPSYGFSPPYHHVASDGSLMSQGLHTNYPRMLQPPGPVYSYPQPSPDVASSSQAPYSTHRNSPHYTSSQGVASGSSSTHARTMPNTPPVHSQPYAGSSSFQSLRYTSPMPQFSYHHHSFPSTPIYSTHFTQPPPFAQGYSASSEPEPQGTWIYLPHHAPVPQQFDGSSNAYHPQYAMHPPFSPSPQSGMDEFYRNSASPSTTPGLPLTIAPPPAQLPDPLQESHPQSPEADLSVDDPPSPSPPQHGDKRVVRRPYHPNPPSSRSEWVMWVGNVPADATHDELWRFFTESGTPSALDVISIFLISRSNCAFVNFYTQSGLGQAIERFNGVPLRPDDARCARLVCRMRKKDDDLQAGVGGQRGMGMHSRWVRERKTRSQAQDGEVSGLEDPTNSPSSISDRLSKAVSTVSLSSDEGPRKQTSGSSTAASYASTTSTFLSRYFPQRYFILKSLTQQDLDLSVQRGVWATQKHNEGILDQAFRTSKDVFLIFGVNKSGEFYGYARMTGPVQYGEQVSWSTRTPDEHNRKSASSAALSSLGHGGVDGGFFSPRDRRLVDTSPLPVDDKEEDPPPQRGNRVHQSAPALLGELYSRPTIPTPAVQWSLDPRFRLNHGRQHSKDNFHLDSQAPMKAIKNPEPAMSADGMLDGKQDGQASQDGIDGGRELGWGSSFSLQWISTERIPFHRTRHLRNPWNHDREVKVSRDGTELEPLVGRRLLDEWAQLAASPPAPTRPANSKRGSSSKVTGAPRT